MKEFEDIRHTGGKITLSNGQTTYTHTNPFDVVLYDIIVSLNGIVLCRGDLMGSTLNITLKIMVPRAGIEPARMFYIRGILNPLRLPVSPPGQSTMEAEAGIEPAYTALQAAA